MRIKNLFEAVVKPGERKGISLKIKKLESLIKKIDDYQLTSDTFGDAKVPDSVAAEYEKVKQGILAELETLNQQKSGIKSEKNNLPVKFVNLMQGIEKNCSQICQLYMKENNKFVSNSSGGYNSSNRVFFYRGIKKSNEDALYGKPFENRKSKDSNANLSEIVNKKMAEAGFEARRDNSTFVSGSKNQAASYGTPYVIFPRDGFSFTYSKEISDLVLSEDTYYLLIDHDIIEPLIDYITAHSKELSSFKFNESDLLGKFNITRTLRSAKAAAEAGLIPKELEPLTELNNIITADSTVKGLKLNNTNLQDALLNGGEVSIHGAYYAVKVEHINDIAWYFRQKTLLDGENKEEKKYEKGDWITITDKDDRDYGVSGKITKVYTFYDEVLVEIAGKEPRIFRFEAIKHMKIEDNKEEDKPQDTLKKGDLVAITDIHNQYYGKTGKVDFVYDDGAVTVHFTDEPAQFFNSAKFLKLIKNDNTTANTPAKAQTELDVGDKVKIIGNHYLAGQTGKIDFKWSIYPNKFDVKLDDSGVVTDKVDGNDIEKINDIPHPLDDPQLDIDNLEWEAEPEVNSQPAADIFKEGDKVKIKDSGLHFPGLTGEITYITKDGANVKFGPDKNDSSYFHFKELEKLPDDNQIQDTEQKSGLDQSSTPNMKTADINFKVKDTVKALAGPAAGLTGAITYISAALKSADVSINGNQYTMPFSNMKLVPPKTAITANPLLSVLGVMSMMHYALKTKQVTFQQLDDAIPNGTPTAQIHQLYASLDDQGVDIIG